MPKLLSTFHAHSVIYVTLLKAN